MRDEREERVSIEWIVVTARATRIMSDAISTVVATVFPSIMARAFIYEYIEKK